MWHQTAVRLRQQYSKVSVGRLCDLFGKTRHAFYDRLWAGELRLSQEDIVVEMLLALRREMPGAGIPTIYKMLHQPLQSHGIKMGRDSLQELRRRHGLIKRPRKKYVATTDSNHRFRKYPNIIRDIRLTAANRLWVTDITYIRVAGDFNFLSLLMDGYSRRILGYCLHPTLSREGPLTALRMAIATLKAPPVDLIHHSDRGIQYCCDDYIAELELYGIAISMTEKGDPYENAMAERLNGVLKQTFGLAEVFESRELALQRTKKAVDSYNNARPHTGIGNLTPEQAHELIGILPRAWKEKKGTRKQTNVSTKQC